MSIDKESLYGAFQKSADQRGKLAMKAAYKSLDIADDDMNINASKSGVGAGTLLGVALAASLGPIAAMLFMGRPATPAAAPPPPITAPAQLIPAQVAPTVDGMIVQEQKQPDGTWKFLWSLPAKLSPDGTAQTLDGRRWRRGADGTTWEASP